MTQVTARQAFSKMNEVQMKHQKRGYGYRVMIINECPDCHGFGLQLSYNANGKEMSSACPTCNNEPNRAEAMVKHGNKWYAKVTQ